MENTSSSFTDMMNSAMTVMSYKIQSGNNIIFLHPNTPWTIFSINIFAWHNPASNFPKKYPMNYLPQFPTNFHSQYSHMFNLFGSQSNYPQFPFSSQGSYQSTYQGMGQYHKKSVMRHQLDPWVSSKVAKGLIREFWWEQPYWFSFSGVPRATTTPVWSDNESNPEESKKKERKKVVFVGVSGKTFG
jgi:hypothetical protein